MSKSLDPDEMPIIQIQAVLLYGTKVMLSKLRVQYLKLALSTLLPPNLKLSFRTTFTFNYLLTFRKQRTKRRICEKMANLKNPNFSGEPNKLTFGDFVSQFSKKAYLNKIRRLQNSFVRSNMTTTKNLTPHYLLNNSNDLFKAFLSKINYLPSRTSKIIEIESYTFFSNFSSKAIFPAQQMGLHAELHGVSSEPILYRILVLSAFLKRCKQARAKISSHICLPPPHYIFFKLFAQNRYFSNAAENFFKVTILFPSLQWVKNKSPRALRRSSEYKVTRLKIIFSGGNTAF